MFWCSTTQRISPFLPFVVAGLLLPAGCGDSAPPKADPVPKAGAQKEDDHHHHHHSHGEKGPHNGALVAIGEDAAHLEVVLDAEAGKVTVYVLDGEAKNPVTIKAEKLELAFTKEHDHGDDGKDKAASGDLPDTAILTLTAVEPAGDGASSVFAGQSDALKGADEFDAVLTSISIDGKEYTKVKFNYPDGNEHDHHH
jgi:hypothetical protein